MREDDRERWKEKNDRKIYIIKRLKEKYSKRQKGLKREGHRHRLNETETVMLKE